MNDDIRDPTNRRATCHGPAFGIDLGTTNSVIASLEGGVPRPIPVDGDPIVPSVVLYAEDGRVVVGKEARNLALAHPDRVVRSVKRRMGRAEPIDVAGRTLGAEVVSAEILRALRAAAEADCGVEVKDVVITVPAYFDDAQRRATLDAGRLAGLEVARLLNEPTAASLVYDRVGTSTQAGQTVRPEGASSTLADDDPELVLVYDLGGGTFDVSVLEVCGEVREVRATAGNSALGGDDFDDVLVRMFLEELGTRRGVEVDAAATARLRRAAETAKIELSRRAEVEVQEAFLASAEGQPVHLRLTVTRRRFEEAISPMLRSTIELARRAVDDARLGPSERIAKICLVGGSTRIPQVRSMLGDAFQAEIHEEVDVDLAVGLGAAIHCGMLTGHACDRILVDVTAHSLGVRAIGDADDPYSLDPPDTFVPILHRNTAVPAERTEELYTAVDDQERVRVDVFQGEAPRCSDNLLVGTFDLPLRPAVAGTAVWFRFAYDLDGIVRVHASQQGGDADGKTALLRLPESSEAISAGDPDPSASAESAVLRRAERMLASGDAELSARLAPLVNAFRAASPERRATIEDELLDVFLDHEAGEDGD